MAKSKKIKLCVLCTRAQEDRDFTTPTHLVHPVTEEIRLFDVHGFAKCRICGARWQRVRNETRLVK